LNELTAASGGVKRILWYTPGESTPRLTARLSGDAPSDRVVFRQRETEFECVCTGGVDETVRFLHHYYANLLVIDLRHDHADYTRRVTAGLELLDILDHPEDLERRYGFHRIIVLVDGPDADAVDRLIAELGARGVGRILRDRSNGSAEFVQRVRDEAVSMILDRQVGKTALAASGGGITGIYFELGALKCLDDVTTPGVNAFEMYFGISAGAVVSSVLSVGYSVDEFMAAIAGVEGGRIPPLDLRLVRFDNVNWPDIARRLKSVGQSALYSLRSLMLDREMPSINNMVLDYSALVGPPFRSDHFEKLLRRILTQQGVSNDFRDLRKPLFVGASDQDRRVHVLFGSEGWDDVPISKAVQASLSVHPAFNSVEIRGRYYEDGAVTRTSDFVEAIDRGADLVMVIDPFVPYVSKAPGTVNRRGVLYNIDQDIRSLSYTRFENTRNWVLRKVPHVSSYTFLPSNRLRRVLSRNPMDHRPFMEIWRGAYISTYERIRVLCHRLRGDLHIHGIELDLDRATEVAERLKRTPLPTFEDFFPDRKVKIRKPPLCCS
jgi:predicted acylesterase/phospholipase RssA